MKTFYKLIAIVFAIAISSLTNVSSQIDNGNISFNDNQWSYDNNNDEYYYLQELTVTPNKPIKFNYTIHTFDYLNIYTIDSNGYSKRYILSTNMEPCSGSITVISSTNKIYVSLIWGWESMGTGQTVLNLTYQPDTDYTINTNPTIINNDQYISGKLGVGVQPTEKLEVNGNVRINNKLSIGVPNTANYNLFVSNQNNSSVNTSIYNTISKNTTSSVYGLRSFTSNNTGNVYGLYSYVSGTAGKRWAGYFDGGDVSVMNGNIGVGVTNPQGILQVRGTYDNSWVYFSCNAGMNSTKYNPKVNYGLAFTSNYSGSEEESIINYSGSNNARLDFTSWNGTILKTEMTLRQGNLGIGTKSPTSKLHIATVNGEGIRIGKVGDAGNINVPMDALSSQYNIDFTGFRDIANDQIGARISALRFNCYQANNAYVQKTGLAFYTNPKGENTGTTDLVERMRIAPDGKIGIGTDAPDHLLTVKGTIHAREVLVDLNGPLADYVFEPDYALMPLSEVESFVKANKHLPEIPSAAEVKENGLNMGEMQNKLLQKIEELTLYVIELQKTNEKQNAEIEALKQVKK